MVSILSKRFQNNNWLKIHYNHSFDVKHYSITRIMIEDSIVAGLTRYTNVWKNIFWNGFLKVDIRGDRVENVLWRLRDITFPPRLKSVVILCGMNNFNEVRLHDIVQGLIAIGSSFKNCFSNPNIFTDCFPAINVFLLINEFESLLMK